MTETMQSSAVDNSACSSDFLIIPDIPRSLQQGCARGQEIDQTSSATISGVLNWENMVEFMHIFAIQLLDDESQHLLRSMQPNAAHDLFHKSDYVNFYQISHHDYSMVLDVLSPNLNPFLDWSLLLMNPDNVTIFFTAKLRAGANANVLKELRAGAIAHYISDAQLGSDYVVTGFVTYLRSAWVGNALRRVNAACGFSDGSRPGVIILNEVNRQNLTDAIKWLASLVRFRQVFSYTSRWVTQNDLLDVTAAAVVQALACGYNEHGMDYCGWLAAQSPELRKELTPAVWASMRSHMTSLPKQANMISFLVNVESVPRMADLLPMEQEFGPMKYVALSRVSNRECYVAFVGTMPFTEYLRMEVTLISTLVDYRARVLHSEVSNEPKPLEQIASLFAQSREADCWVATFQGKSYSKIPDLPVLKDLMDPSKNKYIRPVSIKWHEHHSIRTGKAIIMSKAGSPSKTLALRDKNVINFCTKDFVLRSLLRKCSCVDVDNLEVEPAVCPGQRRMVELSDSSAADAGSRVRTAVISLTSDAVLLVYDNVALSRDVILAKPSLVVPSKTSFTGFVSKRVLPSDTRVEAPAPKRQRVPRFTDVELLDDDVMRLLDKSLDSCRGISSAHGSGSSSDAAAKSLDSCRGISSAHGSGSSSDAAATCFIDFDSCSSSSACPVPQSQDPAPPQSQDPAPPQSQVLAPPQSAAPTAVVPPCNVSDSVEDGVITFFRGTDQSSPDPIVVPIATRKRKNPSVPAQSPQQGSTSGVVSGSAAAPGAFRKVGRPRKTPCSSTASTHPVAPPAASSLGPRSASLPVPSVASSVGSYSGFSQALVSVTDPTAGAANSVQPRFKLSLTRIPLPSTFSYTNNDTGVFRHRSSVLGPAGAVTVPIPFTQSQIFSGHLRPVQPLSKSPIVTTLVISPFGSIVLDRCQVSDQLAYHLFRDIENNRLYVEFFNKRFLLMSDQLSSVLSFDIISSDVYHQLLLHPAFQASWHSSPQPIHPIQDIPKEIRMLPIHQFSSFIFAGRTSIIKEIPKIEQALRDALDQISKLSSEVKTVKWSDLVPGANNLHFVPTELARWRKVDEHYMALAEHVAKLRASLASLGETLMSLFVTEGAYFGTVAIHALNQSTFDHKSKELTFVNKSGAIHKGKFNVADSDLALNTNACFSQSLVRVMLSKPQSLP